MNIHIYIYILWLSSYIYIYNIPSINAFIIIKIPILPRYGLVYVVLFFLGWMCGKRNVINHPQVITILWVLCSPSPNRFITGFPALSTVLAYWTTWKAISGAKSWWLYYVTMDDLGCEQGLVDQGLVRIVVPCSRQFTIWLFNVAMENKQKW